MTRHISASEQQDSSGGVLVTVQCQKCNKSWGIKYGFKPLDSRDKITSWCFERPCGYTMMRDCSSSDRVPLYWEFK